jgi:5-(carboxyamino)imidazole ribonucleotide synthase
VSNKINRVGVIGGGQLAWMMAAAAQTLEVKLVIQTPQADDPAVAIASQTILAAVDDVHATVELAQHCDVITFENEFVNLNALSQLAAQFIFRPSLAAIAPLLDKYHQRQLLQSLNLPVPRFFALADVKELPLPFPLVLKARRHGYDGQGTFILKDQTDLEAVLQQPQTESWLIEEFVPFERELAVMAVRSVDGDRVIYPIVETQQEAQVCRRVLVTQELSSQVVMQIEAIAHSLLTALDYVGILGIELFLTHAGHVLVNEIAPRTHNSGHYSLDACVTSQFEQQLRAVSGRELGDATLTSPAVMVNLLGYESAESDYAEQRRQLAELPNAHVYWYGKSQARPGRKLGHVTVLMPTPDSSRQAALSIAQQVESIWYPSLSSSLST